MSTTFLRIVDKDIPASAVPTEEWRQLPLFDQEPRLTILCLPMLDLHGVTFRRLMHDHKPHVAVDIRSHPYFSMHALDRKTAFAIFAATPTTYVHRPLDLRPPKDPLLFWRIRESAMAIVEDVAGIEGNMPRTFAVLVNKMPEIAVFEKAIRHAGSRAVAIQVLCPD